jgi:ATP/maltotriose-dependent transcriptional regulator MalT
MIRHEAERVLGLSRGAEWTYPSSLGRPVGDDVGPTVQELLAERDRVVEAAAFLVAEGEIESATELAANSWRLWMLARDIAGGRAFLAAVLDQVDAEPSRARALALYGDSVFAFWEGAEDDLRARSEAALEAAQSADDPEALALAHLALSRAAMKDGDFERGRTLAQQAREHLRGLVPALEQGPLHTHAQAMRMLGDDDEAADLFTQSLALNRRIGDGGMVDVELHNLAYVELHRGNVDAAEQLFVELAGRESEGDDPYDQALRLTNEAALALSRGDEEEARSRLDRAEALLAENGLELFQDDRLEFDWLRGRLGSTA